MTPRRLEPVHLDEELVEQLLAFVVPAAQAGAAMAADGVDFVEKTMQARSSCPARTDRARATRRRRRNISTKSEPRIEKNGTLAARPNARARSVLPVLEGHQQDALGIRRALLEFLRLFQEFYDFLELSFARRRCESLNVTFFCELDDSSPCSCRTTAPCCRRSAFAAEEDPETDHQQQRAPRNTAKTPTGWRSVLRLDDDAATR